MRKEKRGGEGFDKDRKRRGMETGGGRDDKRGEGGKGGRGGWKND
jgi:hypothetical protein